MVILAHDPDPKRPIDLPHDGTLTVMCLEGMSNNEGIPQHRKGGHLTFRPFLHSFSFMSVVKIHTDDLQAIYDLLNDIASRKPGRPSTLEAKEMANSVRESRALVGKILGITPPLVLADPPVSTVTDAAQSSPDDALETAPAPLPEPTVEEVVAAIGAEITPEAVVEGDQAEA